MEGWKKWYIHTFSWEGCCSMYSDDSRWQGIQQVCRNSGISPWKEHHAENITTKYRRYCFVSCWDLEVNLRDEKKVSCKEFDGRRRVGPNCCDTDNIFRSNFTGCFFLVWRPFTAHHLFCCCSFLSYIPLEISIKRFRLWDLGIYDGSSQTHFTRYFFAQ